MNTVSVTDLNNLINYFRIEVNKEVGYELEAPFITQKAELMVFYLIAYYNAYFNENLVKDVKILAYEEGFKIDGFQHTLSKYPNNFDPNKILSKEQIDFLLEVFQVFAKYSLLGLRNQTFSSNIWIDKYVTGKEVEIGYKELNDYFEKLVVKNSP